MNYYSPEEVQLFKEKYFGLDYTFTLYLGADCKPSPNRRHGITVRNICRILDLCEFDFDGTEILYDDPDEEKESVVYSSYHNGGGSVDTCNHFNKQSDYWH